MKRIESAFKKDNSSSVKKGKRSSNGGRRKTSYNAEIMAQIILLIFENGKKGWG